MKKEYLSLILVIVALAIIGVFFMLSEDSISDFGPVEIEYGSINVDDQYDLSQVYLNVESAESGFVVVYESMGGAPGAELGVSEYFTQGSHELTIDLASAMIPNYSYITILHIDDGDQKFDVQDDHAAMVEDTVVRPSFDARSIELDNQ